MKRLAWLATLLGTMMFAAGCPQGPDTPAVDTGEYETPVVPTGDVPEEDDASDTSAEPPEQSTPATE